MNYYNATSGTTGATTIVQLPLAFVRSDAIYVDVGKIWGLGQGGRYWSRTALSSTYAYYLGFDPTGVYPSNFSYDGDRYWGFPLRCL